MTAGERIKRLRIDRGLTLEELGKRVGVGKSTIRKWETGAIANMRQDKVAALAAALGASPLYIMGLESEGSEGAAANVIELPAVRRVPIVGTIACGAPVLARENIEGAADSPEHIHADFALRCKGDSMINARIFDGDIVYIRRQDTVDDGEIAAVLIDNEATLKRVRLFKDHIVLEPENPQYRPMVFWGEEMNALRILGKAAAFTSLVR